jgi:DUF4097 and DUF4098 domain-containing protein YvlB
MSELPVVNVHTRAGSVHVRAVAGSELSVEGGSIERQEDGSVLVRRLRDAKTITVTCPAGTDITIGTVSGSVETEGSLGATRIATVSGRIRVEEVAQIDVRTKSGKVEVGKCAGECRVVTTSSKVRVGRAQRASIAAVSGVVLLEEVEGAEVKTVSGKVELGTAGAGSISVKTVSGKVEIRVPRTSRPATRLKSLSGRVQCDCEQGADGEIAVASVSGQIHVSCG